ncbi:hypothetical protein NECID01_0136 [Nematocida sp. AWRm77]|nr:hypothetical protein NECID01_0136 [Nematocida sp. AWRm77]
MDVQFKLLSYNSSTEEEEKYGRWWWEGAPVFTKEHLVKVRFNGQRIPFSEETGEFGIHLSTAHSAKMGILEISILMKGLFINESLGFCFRTVEELLPGTGKSVHYVRILSTNDPVSGWLCCKECRHPNFKPQPMDFFIALHASVEQSSRFEIPPPYGLKIARFLTGKHVAERLMDTQELLGFLFRDLRNFSELAYGGKEMHSYYSHMDKQEFRHLPPSPETPKKRSLVERLSGFFSSSSSTPTVGELRGRYSKFLLGAIKPSPYAWHAETELFYARHLKLYRYAISSYGQAFLNVHSILNMIQKVIPHCTCKDCACEKTPSENKFFHAFTGIPYNDILHKDSTYLQHVLFIERSTCTLYITFKGTLNTREALIDLDYKYFKYKGSLFHNGIFQESLRFFNKYKEVISQRMEEHSLTKIKLVGQSLGGALATLVCMLFKECPLLSRYTIGSVGYSSPPIISNPSVFRKWSTADPDSAIVTLVYGNDIVPMLCLGKIFELHLIVSHLYAISVSKFKNKHKYIHQLLRKMRKRGMTKLYIPGTIYQIRNTRTDPSTFLVRQTHWSFYSAIKLSTKGPIHHMPGVMINALRKSLAYFYGKE